MKLYKVVILYFFLLISLVSCPNKKTYTIKFVSYNKNDTLYNNNLGERKVVENTILTNILNIPNVSSFDLGDNRYTFKYWTATQPTTSDIFIEGSVEKFSEDTIITEDKTLYAVFEKSDIKYTVKFFCYNKDDLSYNNKLSEKTVAKDTKFFDITKNIDVEEFQLLGYRYTFKYWTDTQPTTNEIFIEGSVEKFSEDTIITEDKIFYAVYEKNQITFSVTFMHYDTDESMYKTKDILFANYGDMLKDISNKPIFTAIKIGKTTYLFNGWTLTTSESTIIENAEFFNSQITNNITLYATYSKEYLTFTAIENTEISFNLVKHGASSTSSLPHTISLQYKKDIDADFKDYKWGDVTAVQSATEGERIYLPKGESIYFRGNNGNLSTRDVFLNFISTNKVEASGSVMDIMFSYDVIPNEGCFKRLFDNCSTLLTAPSVPATLLKNYCYEYMFSRCSSLNIAPDLNAKYLADGCYSNMFVACENLTTPPYLSSENLEVNCYDSMFYGCSLLKVAPELPCETLKDGCYKEMFRNCSSLQYIKCLAITEAYEATYRWLDGVADNGEFMCKGTFWSRGSGQIPENWKVTYI